MKILIAEDDPASRLLLTRVLEKLGYEVVATKDGREAWEIYETGKFPLLILDWMMPYLTGLDLCRKIRARAEPVYTYIVLLTALGGKDYYLEGMQAGADDFITKPFDKDKLAARLRVAERTLALKAEVKQLEGLLPICPICKKIQETERKWTPLDDYVTKTTEASFSHSVCPECYVKEVKPQLERLREDNIWSGKHDQV